MPTSPSDTQDAIRVPDPNLVEQIWSQTLIDHGFFTRNRDGQQIADPKPMAVAVLETMDSHMANNNKELAAKAVTKFELYAEVLPNGPGVSSLPTNLEEEAVRDLLQRQVWSLTQTGSSGHVQKAYDTTNLVLCEASVARTKLNEETGRREPTTEMGRFLTSDHHLILTYYTGPAGAKFLRAAKKLENQLGLVTRRQPELTGQVSRQMAAVVRQAVASIPSADPKQAAAKNATNGDEAST